MAGTEGTAIPEGNAEKLERVTKERAYLIQLCAELRKENSNLKAELAGVPVEELPF